MSTLPLKNRPGTFGYGYRQPFPMPGRTGPNLPNQTNVNTTVNTGQPPAQPNVSGYEAMVQALAAQQAQQRGAQQSRLGRGLTFAPGNKARNVGAGALMNYLGQRSTNQGLQAEADAYQLSQQQIQAQEAEKLQKQADATYEWHMANHGNPDIAKAAAAQVQAGNSAALPKQAEVEQPDVEDYNSMQTQIEKVVGKPFMERTQAIRDIVTYAEQGSGFSDHALIFRYMKFLDPASTVREGEFATVENTGSIPERVRVAYNKAIGGEKLSDDQRQDIVTAVTSAYPAYVEEYEKRMEPFKQRADKFGMDWELLSVPEPYPMENAQVARNKEEKEEAGETEVADLPAGYELRTVDGETRAVYVGE